MTAGELLVKLGFEVDTLKLNEFIKDLGEVNLSSVVAAAGLKGMLDGLTDIMKAADGVSSSLNKLSGITGVQQQVFQQWDNAAQQFNLSAGETNSILGDIQKNINLLKVGQGNAVAWAQLFHIPIAGRENDPAGVFHDILKSLEGMDPVQARLRLNMAGINEDAMLLVGHEDEIADQVHNTNEQFRQMGEFHAKINKLSNDWKVLLVGIASALTPILDPLIQILNTIIDLVIQLEEASPRWVKDLAAAAVIWGTIYGLIRATVAAMGILSGLSAIKFLGPLLASVGTIASRLNPIIAGITGAAALGAVAYDLLKPKDQQNQSTDNSGDVNQTNHYNIHSNDPNDIMRRISEYHNQQNRDVQGQSPLTSW